MQQKCDITGISTWHKTNSSPWVPVKQRSIPLSILFSPILTDLMRFPTYVRRREGGDQPPTSAFAVCANECALSQRYTVNYMLRHISKRGITHFDSGNKRMWGGWHLNGDLMTWLVLKSMRPAQRKTSCKRSNGWEGRLMQSDCIVWLIIDH